MTKRPVTHLERAEADGGTSSVEQQSIFAQIEKGLLNNPQGLAVICMHQPRHHLSRWLGGDDDASPDSNVDCLTLTYSELHQAALSLVCSLDVLGAQPGQMVLCMVENGGEYAILLWACAILRLALSAIDPLILDKNDTSSLEEYLQLLKPDLIVVQSSDGSGVVDSTYSGIPEIPRPKIRLFLHQQNNQVDSPAAGWISLHKVVNLKPPSTFCARSTVQQARLDDDPARIHSILFTSGTSAGRPKGCPLTVSNMVHILTSQSWLINGPTAARVLQQAHNSRAIGPQHTLQTWREGGTIVMSTGPSFAIEHTIEAILRYHVSFIVLSPAMVHALTGVALPMEARDAVKTIQVGGDVVTREILGKCVALFPEAKVCVNHGMSEGGGFFEWPFFRTLLEEVPFFGGEICPAGKVAGGARVKIWDAKEGQVAVMGQSGELHVSCESLIKGYLGGVDAASFYEDGEGVEWMNTGDIAIMTETDVDKLVYILGRAKDAVLGDGGTIIMPAVVESCIERFTGSQTCVVPLGEKPYAVLKEWPHGMSKDEIVKDVEETLGEKHSITHVVSLSQVGLDRFPVNATHKIVKLEVQKALLKCFELTKG
ncbi:hypothetical protein QBC37DRAFT_296761 [Rhypophila decipiens]|uniref:AMP-dependent synthetase/ligase domain-containing protein n=1 Tax=Rhypophila decipiens TaxID=261697 RepID=A0AAN6XZG0_9PEZI|nr:hypothetical protein QBC37DRAFT_296761 [Rhypophila decipiens]